MTNYTNYENPTPAMVAEYRFKLSALAQTLEAIRNTNDWRACITAFTNMSRGEGEAAETSRADLMGILNAKTDLDRYCILNSRIGWIWDRVRQCEVWGRRIDYRQGYRAGDATPMGAPLEACPKCGQPGVIVEATPFGPTNPDGNILTEILGLRTCLIIHAEYFRTWLHTDTIAHCMHAEPTTHG